MAEDIVRLDLGFVNAYIVVGSAGPILVDTGLSMQWAGLMKGIEAAGYRPEELRLVLLTHGDIDHAGNCPRLREEYHLPVAAHSAEAEALETGIAPPRKVRGLKRRLLMALRRLRRGKAGPSQEGFKPDVLLEEGGSLEAYGLEARVFHLPGHTRGSLALLLKSGGLIVGDIVSNRGRPEVSPYVENEAAYRASLGRLKALAAQATEVYPGHGSPFEASALASAELSLGD